jgi:hypothetical protein
MEWLENRLDVVVDWSTDSLDLFQVELLWVVVKRMVKRMKPETIDDLRHALVTDLPIVHQQALPGIRRETGTLSG